MQDKIHTSFQLVEKSKQIIVIYTNTLKFLHKRNNNE